MSDPWVKLWWSWYASRSHEDLSFDSIHLGGYLMQVAKASPEPPWLLRPDGVPKSVIDLARGARMRGTNKVIERRMSAALRELVGAHTLVIRNGDEAFGFTRAGWAKYQLSESYFRVKNFRTRLSNGECNDKATDRDQRSEIRDQRSEIRDQNSDLRGERSERAHARELRPKKKLSDIGRTRENIRAALKSEEP